MTTWKRLEGNTRTMGIEEGLAARIADPLWMLGRQWQFGELRGEDCGSPVSVRVETSAWPLSSYTPRIERANDETIAQPLLGTDALRPRVEAERIGGVAAFRHNVECGLQFLRALDQHGATSLRAAFIAAFPLAAPANLDGVDEVAPSRLLRRLTILARGAVNAETLLLAGTAVATTIPDYGSVPAALRPKVTAALSSWLTWHNARVVEPAARRPSAWRDRRLEHAFSVGACIEHGPVSYGAAEYDGRNLDWSSFDLVPLATGGDDEPPPDRPPVSQAFELLPVPVSFRGMPAGRFWEMEDSDVSFGAATTAPFDLGRLLLIEHATIYSDDWFLVPVRARLGNLLTVDRLVVRNTFGESATVASKAELDAAAGARLWKMCEPTVKKGATELIPAPLFLPPALSVPLEGEPLERVDFVRDESANLAWGIERRVEGVVKPRRDRQLDAHVQAHPDDDSLPAGTWRYRTNTDPPAYFVPFVPERIAGSTDMFLRRGRLASWKITDGPKGRILDPRTPLRLFEEEVQRGGVSVLRRVRAARDSDGKLHVWTARIKQPGRGETASGLRFDEIEGID